MTPVQFDWVSVLWPALAGVTACVGVICLAAALQDRRRLSPLAAFAVNAFSITVYIFFELQLLRAQSGGAYSDLLRWSHVWLAAIFISAIVFIRLYLQAGRLWLAATAITLRLAALLINFSIESNLNFTSITSIRQVELFGGARVSVPDGIVNPWTAVGVAAVVMFLVFVADAMIECWRRGEPVARRRAALIGGSYLIAVGGAAANGYLILFGSIDSVYTLGLPFTAVVLAVSAELGRNVVRASALASRLKDSDRERRLNQDHLGLAAEAAQLAPWEFDLEKGEFRVSDQARALLGFDRSCRIDLRRIREALDPADRSAAYAESARVLRIGGEFDLEYRVNPAGAPSRWLHTRGRLDKDAAGRPVLLRGVTFDVTDRREAAEQFRVLLEAAAFGMLGFDRDGTVVLVNAGAERLFGQTREELVGRHVQTLLSGAAQEWSSADIAGLVSADVDRAPVQRQLTGRRKDGSIVPMEVGLTAIRVRGRQTVLASLIDLTERKRVEAQLEAQHNELSHLARVTMLSELSGSLAHELNQPLTAILSNAQAALRFLDSKPPNLAEVRDILHDVVSDDKRAGEIIQGLRLLLKRGEMRRERFDLNDVVESVFRLLKSTLVNADVKVLSDLAPDLRHVDGDRVQLQQVVLNLAMNACEAMREVAPDQRRIVVKTGIQEGRLALVSISDHGPGIAPGQLERVFDPFFTTKPNGLGLGLAVCRQIIAAHGGRLSARDGPGSGATFDFTLPLAPEV